MPQTPTRATTRLVRSIIATPFRRTALGLVGCGAVAAILAVPSTLAGGGSGQVQVPTTGADFFMPGTQPEPNELLFDPIQPSSNCTFCHSDYNAATAPFDTWIVSLMGQSARDPVWHAAVSIANQDANLVGELCIRCHSPGGWLAGRAVTGTTAEFIPTDYDGINCNYCHRLVNPVFGPDSASGYPGDPPEPDLPIITDLATQGLIPQGFGDGRHVMDPKDNRRGPLSDVTTNLHGLTPNGEYVKLIYSPFHTKSQLCGTCHDVSNPVFVKQPDGSYGIGAIGEPHPTQEPNDMFPEQRTYSEWANSEFATTGVSFPDDRFGGPDHPTGIMSSCQDCHMPINYGGACLYADGGDQFPYRNVPQHSFSGVNTWVIPALRTMLGEEADYIGLTQDRVEAAVARNVAMLRNASDMQLSQAGNTLIVRVINQSGHKLPTGYPEGRRMWLNVKFLNAKDQVVGEVGGYDYDTATPSLENTKVYEARHGLNYDVAGATGLPYGPNMRLALGNKKFFDNRIPPRGFTNANFEAIGAPIIGATYADGQYWDDSTFPIPAGTAKAVVTLYFQVTTREYAEFLRDENFTDSNGQQAYDLWNTHGKSAPVDMDHAELAVVVGNPADLNGDGSVNAQDLAILLGAWGTAGPGDLDASGQVNAADLAILLGAWGT